MIMNLQIRPRGSGTTELARTIAESNRGYYTDRRDNIIAKLQTLSKLDHRVFVVDNVLFTTKETQQAIMDYQDCFDFYLLGSLTIDPNTLLCEPFKQLVKSYYPELFI